jgi:hypothetical protein
LYRHDYILKLIERLGIALRALRDTILRRTREDEAVTAEIGEMARQAGLDLDVARQLEPELLMMWLAPTGDRDPAKLWLMAELLSLSGLHAHTTGGPSWRGDLERAAALLKGVPADWRPGDGLPSAGERLEEISEALRQQDGGDAEVQPTP